MVKVKPYSFIWEKHFMPAGSYKSIFAKAQRFQAITVGMLVREFAVIVFNTKIFLPATLCKAIVATRQSELITLSNVMWPLMTP